MLIWAPRTRRSSSSLIASKSRPRNSAVPLTSAADVSPSRVSMETLLPDPDSPTMPSVAPAWTSNDAPRTARTMPSGVRKLTCKPSTASVTGSEAGQPACALTLSPGQPDIGRVTVEVVDPEVASVHPRRVEHRPLVVIYGHHRGFGHGQFVGLSPPPSGDR